MADSVTLTLTPEEHQLLVAALSALPLCQLVIKVQQQAQPQPENAPVSPS